MTQFANLLGDCKEKETANLVDYLLNLIVYKYLVFVAYHTAQELNPTSFKIAPSYVKEWLLVSSQEM